jgi:hypothetical protein
LSYRIRGWRLRHLLAAWFGGVLAAGAVSGAFQLWSRTAQRSATEAAISAAQSAPAPADIEQDSALAREEEGRRWAVYNAKVQAERETRAWLEPLVVVFCLGIAALLTRVTWLWLVEAGRRPYKLSQ